MFEYCLLVDVLVIDVVTYLDQDPELMAAFSDPEVMAALQDGTFSLHSNIVCCFHQLSMFFFIIC